MRTRINTLDNINRNIFTILVAGIFLSVFLYVYFISTSVVNIVQRKNIEVEAQALSSNIGELENKYISLSKRITLSYARSVGFVEPRSVSFVSSNSFAINLGRGI